MDRGAWWATVHRVAKSRTQLSDLAHTRVCVCVCVCVYREREREIITIIGIYRYLIKSINESMPK